MFNLNFFYLILIISATSASEFDELCDESNEGTFIDDIRTCGGFFHCDNGVANPGTCPDHLYFNPIGPLCDWPENVVCVEEPPITPSTPEPTPEPTPAPPPAVTCPTSGSHLLPHPQSCALFVLCFGGAPVEQECPSGKHFAEHLQTCVEPGLANCIIDHTVCEGVNDFDLIPSTVDCNEYFICFNATSIRRNCAPELHFNPTESRCESRHTAGCIIGRNPEDYEPQCPEDQFFAVLPNGYSCKHFFYCVNGIESLQECAPGFLFDTENLRCDYDINVVCL